MSDAKKIVTLRYIRIAGIVAAIAAATNGIGDIFYQAVPNGVYDKNMEFMWRVSEPNLYFGAYIGVFAIALLWLGYWHVYQGIRKAGPWLSLPPFLIGMFTVGIGCTIHFAIIYPALVGHRIIAGSGDLVHVLEQLHTSMVHASNILWTVYLSGVAVFSLWLMVLVFIGKTHYPRWFGILNPLFLTIAYTLLVPHIPKYGAYLVPAAALSDAVFFALSTWLLWNIKMPEES